MPESPASFLKFLFKVRESGSLDPEHGPSVVHCSAGIGRSGTFALVDTCLILVGVVVVKQADRVAVKEKAFLQRGWSQSFDIYTKKNNTFFVAQDPQLVVRQEVERISKLKANPQKTYRVGQSSEQFSELGSLV